MANLDTMTTKELRQMLHEKDVFDLRERVREEIEHILFDRIEEATVFHN